MKKSSLWLGVLGALVILLTVAEAKVLINAAGATFPYPIYGKWFDEFGKTNPDAQINYQSIGSGGGIRQFTEGTVDFGASDMPMTDEQIGKVKNKPLHFPTVLGGLVPTYNIPGVTQELKFTPEALAGIYLGKIKKWNDPELQKANAGAKLPDNEIVVVHRSDGSGTTFIWTDYLSKVSPDWAGGPSKGTAINWPTGVGGKGNEGVAAQVREFPGAIGYVELIYALQNHIDFGSVKNASGNWVKASIEGVTAAAATAKIPPDYRVSITNAPGANSYPISSFTYLLIPTHPTDMAKEKVIKDLLSWSINSGEGEVSTLSYAPLPDSLKQKVLQTVYSLP